MMPGTAGTDDRGFRNRTALVRADALVIGDSQTWGFRITHEQTFASLLANDVGIEVYQMANGSYGPVQYRELLRRGLELAPKLVIVAIYFGNDLIDASDYAGLEGAESVRSKGRSYTVRDSSQLRGKQAPNRTLACIDALLGVSRLLDAAARVVKQRLQGGALDSQPGALFFRHGTAATVLLPGYRFVTVNPESQSVSDGVAITARCLQDIAARCREQQTRCVLLAIPTKEFTYAQWQGERLSELAELHAAETHVRQQVFAAASAAGIPVVDLSEALISALKDGRMPWFATGDGHINAVGHQIAAELLGPHWRR
jgi:lysophospholipase L1-like esterase